MEWRPVHDPRCFRHAGSGGQDGWGGGEGRGRGGQEKHRHHQGQHGRRLVGEIKMVEIKFPLFLQVKKRLFSMHFSKLLAYL